MRLEALTASYLLDWMLGDPGFLPHPVRMIGHAVQTGRAFRGIAVPSASHS
jgi:cobalamin biosynthesis protein CobD/CbiB